jgi:ligand-binding sensor domain-containing protein
MNLVSPLSRLDGSRSPAGTLEHVFAIAEDKQGHLWFGDRDTGAWRYDGKTMRHLPVDPALKTPHVWCIYQDMDDNLLLGMADKGVYRFDGEGFEQVF